MKNPRAQGIAAVPSVPAPQAAQDQNFLFTLIGRQAAQLAFTNQQMQILTAENEALKETLAKRDSSPGNTGAAS